MANQLDHTENESIFMNELKLLLYNKTIDHSLSSDRLKQIEKNI